MHSRQVYCVSYSVDRLNFESERESERGMRYTTKTIKLNLITHVLRT